VRGSAEMVRIRACGYPANTAVEVARDVFDRLAAKARVGSWNGYLSGEAVESLMLAADRVRNWAPLGELIGALPGGTEYVVEVLVDGRPVRRWVRERGGRVGQVVLGEQRSE